MAHDHYLKPSWRLLHERYRAGIKAVRAGADPLLTLSYVLEPTPEAEKLFAYYEKQQKKAA